MIKFKENDKRADRNADQFDNCKMWAGIAFQIKGVLMKKYKQ